MISAIIFAFWPEEEHYIEVCLKTVAWADEIIVIDNGATPKTLEIARRYASRIERSDSTDFSQRHNLGQKLAKGDWILYVDADERVSKNLQKEIKKELESPTADAYQVLRVNYFLGRKVRFGDRFPDYVARLFKKDKLAGWSGEIHESSNVVGKMGYLNSPLYHLTHRNIMSMMDKTKNFAEHEAKLRYKDSHPHPVVGWRLVKVFLTEFFNRIIKMQGFRQGTEGWIDGIFQAFSLFIVYARLWEMRRKPTLDERYKQIDREILEEFK